MNFFVKPFILLNESDKTDLWMRHVEIFQHLGSGAEFPFSFSEFINLPLFLINRLIKSQIKIAEKKANALKSMNSNSPMNIKRK